MKSLVGFATLVLCAGVGTAAGKNLTEASEQASFQVEIIADNLDTPWGLEFAPDDSIILTLWDRGVVFLPAGGRGSVITQTQEGLTDGSRFMDILLSQDFADTNEAYVCVAYGAEDDNHTRIYKGKLDSGAFSDLRPIYIAANPAHQYAHHGCRLLWDDEGMLIATLGDRRHFFADAQDAANVYGAVLRLTPEGAPAPGNPIPMGEGALPEILVTGIRNIQGADFHPETGALWFLDHGPLGGDEVNILSPGANYGWPIATYGIDYSGEELTDTPLRDGATPPLFYWYPSIAPSGTAFYSGEDFPKWRGDLFLGALASRRLMRLELIGDRVVAVEELLAEIDERIRHVKMGPDGKLYVLTDGAEGKLIRLIPHAE